MRHHRLESRLSAAATMLVGGPALVRCQTAGQQFVAAGSYLGYVRYGRGRVPERETLIKRARCRSLASYPGSDRERPDRDEVVAVHILSHEARHTAGTTNEAQAECEAVQRDAWAARLLGATAEQSQAQAHAYWRDVYPLMNETYRSPGGRRERSSTSTSSPRPWPALAQ